MGEQETMYDAVVVGTGFGGAVTALRLVEAGQRICVLERGRRFGPDDFPDMPTPGELLPDTSRLIWGADRGMWDVQDLDQVLTVQLAGYGGGSLGYACVHLVPPEDVFESWPFDRASLLPYYALGRHMLSLETVRGLEGKLHLPLTKTESFMDTARALGREDASIHPPLAIRLTADDGGDEAASPGTPTDNPVSGRAQATCVHCGACVSGCRHRAKNTLDYNYLALVERARDEAGRRLADVRTLAEVIELEPPGADQGWRVTYRDHHVGSLRRTVRSRRVFLCAGSVNTTKLLFRNRARLPRLGANLGHRYFPNADALGVVHDTRTRQNPGYGPTITSAMVAKVPRAVPPSERLGLRFDWSREASPPRPPAPDWLMLQDGGYDPSLQPILAMLRAPLLMGRNRHDDVGKFEDLSDPDEHWAARKAKAEADAATPEANYPRQPGATYTDPYRDPLLGSLQGLLRSGKFVGYLPDFLGRVLPEQLDARFRNRIELPSLRRVAEDTQSIALFAWLWNEARNRDASGPNDEPRLNRRGEVWYGMLRKLSASVAGGVGMTPGELAKAAMQRSRQELGTDDIGNFVLGWLRFLSNHDDAATAPFARRTWTPQTRNTFGDARPDAPGEFVHMLLAMGRDSSPWRLRYRPPLAQVERRAREAALAELADAERWEPERLRAWAERQAEAGGISHAPEQDTPHHTDEERERLEDQGELEANPPPNARTRHTRGTSHAMPVYAAEERLMRDVAKQMGGELRLNPRWAFAGQVVTVHSQGGCGIDAGGDPQAVCDAYGRVRGYEGLYVQDAALFPGPVGVNPSHTIVALVERNLEEIRREDLGEGDRARADQFERAMREAADDPVDRPPYTTPEPAPMAPAAKSVGVRFEERLTGAIAAMNGGELGGELGGDDRLSPNFKDSYLRAEQRGRGKGQLLELSMSLAIADLATFVESGDHEGEIDGTVRIRCEALFGDDHVHEGRCEGGIRVLPEADETRAGLESMRYALRLELDGRRLELLGRKVIIDDDGPDLWADTTALFVRVRTLDEDGAPTDATEFRGVLRLGLADFVEDMIKGLEVTGTRDPAQIVWALVRFMFFFGAGMQRSFFPGMRRFMERLVRNELGIR